MDNINSKTKFVIFILFGILIGFLFAFFLFHFKNSEVEEKYSSDNKVLKFEAQTANKSTNQTIGLANQNQTGNCLNSISNSNKGLYLSNSKLNEAINLLNEAINISQIKKEYQNQSSANVKRNFTAGLLSPRIYAGILEPKSFLITNFAPLQKDIENYLSEHNISASVYVENLRNGVNFGINEDQGYFPASLNKLPVAILIMQKIEDGKLTLDTMLPIKDYERTDTFGTLYLTKEKELTVRILMEKMLEASDNTAFNVLYDNVDRGELIKLLDYYNIRENTEYPFKRVEYGSYTDLVNPIHLYNIFSSLYLSTTLYAQDSEYILSMLTHNSDFNIEELANLPANVTVAEKFGEYYTDDTKLFHDCGIIYIGQGRFFYCIMMKEVEPDNAKPVMGYFVNHLYNYVVDTRVRLEDSLSRKHNLSS